MNGSGPTGAGLNGSGALNASKAYQPAPKSSEPSVDVAPTAAVGAPGARVASDVVAKVATEVKTEPQKADMPKPIGPAEAISAPLASASTTSASPVTANAAATSVSQTAAAATATATAGPVAKPSVAPVAAAPSPAPVAASPASLVAAPATAEPTRTMEDTVAELLRPMLRQWLDTNMPRVVEKALRVELAASAKPKTDPAKP